MAQHVPPVNVQRQDYKFCVSPVEPTAKQEAIESVIHGMREFLISADDGTVHISVEFRKH